MSPYFIEFFFSEFNIYDFLFEYTNNIFKFQNHVFSISYSIKLANINSVVIG